MTEKICGGKGLYHPGKGRRESSRKKGKKDGWIREKEGGELDR